MCFNSYALNLTLPKLSIAHSSLNKNLELELSAIPIALCEETKFHAVAQGHTSSVLILFSKILHYSLVILCLSSSWSFSIYTISLQWIVLNIVVITNLEKFFSLFLLISIIGGPLNIIHQDWKRYLFIWGNICKNRKMEKAPERC